MPTGEMPLLSIVIPTRNRPSMLVSTTRNMLRSARRDFEVVIHDNSDMPGVEQMLREACADSRVRYRHTDGALGFSEMFDRSVSLARGEYLCIIGDDDGVTPELIEVTQWAKAQGIESVVPSLPAVYGWPDFRLRYYGADDAGKLKIRSFTGAVRSLDPATELRRSARSGFQDFTTLPRIYYGIIRRDVVDRVRAQAGAVFFGTSPDLSGAVALASQVATCVTIDYPVFVPGSSSPSGSGRGAMKRHVGSLESEGQTKAFAAGWPPIIPRFYSVQTVWAQAGIATLEATNNAHFLRDFDVSRLYGKALVYNWMYRGTILRSLTSSLRQHGHNVAGGWMRFVAESLRATAVRVWSHLSRSMGRGYFNYARIETNVVDIDDAIGRLMRYIAEEQRPLPFRHKSHP